ncbi:class I SAM-dependent methyltransferase [Paludisphaera rhizosphaerae]|uniref:class I SAM-dependent methyltransferase n=1 Tax=Paludisphaera rhizosphaerae TaxID=2711216 RepID=UPI0013EB16EC|nr:class I SAM-dependent methyltransferase [Paludisphaera rhizosphaerae]
MDQDVVEAAVVRAVHPRDEMFTSPDHYFGVGRSALACIDLALRGAATKPSDVKRILDLPCGHGRVLRYLRAAFPEAEITACDILREGVDFCASTFGAVPVYSEDDPHKIPVDREAFDLIWVGSLFTHLDSGLWIEFLDAFRTFLRPGGVLVFTAAGLAKYRRELAEYKKIGSHARLLAGYQRHGFGFEMYQHLDYEYYGSSVSSPAWVFSQIATVGGLRTVHFAEMAWDSNQDCYAFVRDDSHRAEVAQIAQ